MTLPLSHSSPTERRAGFDLELKRVLTGSRSPFAMLDPATLSSLANAMWQFDIPPNAYLFHEGDPSDRLYVVLRGTLKVGTTGTDGRTLAFTHIRPGDTIGDVSIIEGGGRTASIRALSKCRFGVIGRRELLQLAEAHGSIGLALARSAARTVRRLSTQREEQATLPLSVRLARLLLHLIAEDPLATQPVLHIRQQDLADLLAVTRESINKHLRLWEEAGIVTLGRSRISVNELDRLQGEAAPEDLML